MEPVVHMPMTDFMGRFGAQLFNRASEYLEPEYVPGVTGTLEQAFDALPLSRPPFPDQKISILAAAQHLFVQDASMCFLDATMGTGKTLMAQVIAALAPRPQRVIVVCPPHLVQKWAREIQSTLAFATVKTINHAGANAVLARDASLQPGPPDKLTFYIIGRVRMRMSFKRQPVLIQRKRRILNDRRPSTVCVCPDCGGIQVVQVPAKSKKDFGRTFYMDQAAPSDTPHPSEDAEFEPAGDTLFALVQPFDNEIKPPKTCQFVLGAEGVQSGCGAQLWQAVRNHQHNPEYLLHAAFQKLPRVGASKAAAISGLSDVRNIIAALENGTVPASLRNILGKAATKAVQEYIDTVGFSVVDGDFAPVEFIKRQLPKRWFDMAILDELHELKGDDSAQGTAFGILAGCVEKTLGLTGTLVDGYAQSLHPLLFRANPRRMLEIGYGANEAHRFQREMGQVKEIVTEIVNTDVQTARVTAKVTRQTRNLPGLDPAVITHVLLPNTVFLDLSDIENGLQKLGQMHGQDVKLLPSCREVFVKVPMDPKHREAVIAFSLVMLATLKAMLGEKKHYVLAPIIAALLYYPDGAFEPLEVWSKREEDRLGYGPAIDEGMPLAKERFMIDLALREKAAGRKLLVYTIYTDRRDLTGRYRSVLEAAGLKVKVLKSSVPTERREQWVADQCKSGLDVLICNPELVKTGLDLFDFVTILFMQTGYRTDTVQQASRRSWRIGQIHPVRIYYAGYAESPQMQALSLTAKKMVVSNQAHGSIAKIGLSEAIEDDEDGASMMAMANAILDSVRDKSRDAITGAIAHLAEDDSSQEYQASGLAALKQLMALAAKTANGTRVVDPRPVEKVRKVTPVAQPVITRSTEEVILDDLFADIFGGGSPSAPTKPAPKAQSKRPDKPQTDKQSSLFTSLF